MPVIRGPSHTAPLQPNRRQDLLEGLTRELSGETIPHGPVIYEIPLKGTDGVDILVVWDEWEGVRSQERSDLIEAAYAQSRGRAAEADSPKYIAQALGVTYQEAIAQNLLPYAVVPMFRQGEAEPAELRRAMREEGGIFLPDGTVVLRFPAISMAEAAHRRLMERLPQGYWSMVQDVGHSV